MPITLIRGEARKSAVLEHRRQKLTDAINRLLESKADPEYVAMRGKKLKEITGRKSYN